MNYLYVLITELIAFSSLAFAEAEIEGRYGGGGEHAKILRWGPVRIRKYHLFFQGISIPLFLLIVLVAAGIDLGLILILCIGYFLGGLLQDFIWFLINPHYGIKRFIPVPKKPKISKESKVLKEKGKTLYGERMKWFKERREYNKAITLLARRLKRTLIRSLELKHYDIDTIITQIKLIKPNANVNRIKYGLKKIEDVEKNKKKIKEEYEFLNLYYEMRWISDAVTK